MLIDGVEYLPVQKSSDVKIVILQRGWVYVGRLIKENEMYRLDNANCVRVWGTTKGIGELISGPTSSTKLDSCGTVRFHELTIIAMIDCEEKKWSKYL